MAGSLQGASWKFCFPFPILPTSLHRLKIYILRCMNRGTKRFFLPLPSSLFFSPTPETDIILKTPSKKETNTPETARDLFRHVLLCYAIFFQSVLLAFARFFILHNFFDTFYSLLVPTLGNFSTAFVQ